MILKYTNILKVIYIHICY